VNLSSGPLPRLLKLLKLLRRSEDTKSTWP
jgi:hypothetical protein